MYRYVRINMSTGNARIFDIPRERWILGGRGLISQVLYTEMDPSADPLSSKNVLVLASGMFAGCPLSCFDEVFLGTKSPCTRHLESIRFMSRAARIMASMDLRLVIIEGRCANKKQYVLLVDRGRVTLLPVEELLPGPCPEEVGGYALNEGLQRHFGDNACIVSWGQAAALRSPEASLLVSGSSGGVLKNIPGRGISAVMASKGLRAVVLRGGAPLASPSRSSVRAGAICRDTACLLRCARIHNDLKNTPYGQASLCRDCLEQPQEHELERICADLGLSSDGLFHEFQALSFSDEGALRRRLMERCRRPPANKNIPRRKKLPPGELTLAAFDSMGLCHQALKPEEHDRALHLMAELAGAVYGGEWNRDMLLRMGADTLSRENAFNDWAGREPAEHELSVFTDEKESL